MQFKKTVVAVALGLGLVASAQAAFIEDLGTLSFDNSLFYSYSPNKNLGNWFTGDSFTNEFTFSVADSLIGSANLKTGGTVPLIWYFDFPGHASMENVVFSIYRGTDISAPPVFTLDKNGTGSFLIDSSFYTLVVTGNLFGKGDGSYDFRLTAGQVPEPAEYAMLLAGLGVVGLVARRRKITVN